MINVGTYDAGIIKPTQFGIKAPAGTPVRMTDAAIANGKSKFAANRALPLRLRFADNAESFRI